MTEIKVTFGALATGQVDVATTATRLRGQLEELRRFIAPLVATWQGQAAVDYQVKQAKWDTAAADLQLVLEQVGVALGAAHEGYVRAEQVNRARWQT